MKIRYGISFGTLALALSFVPNCAAQCGGFPQPKLHKNAWFLQSAPIRLLPAAFKADEDEHGGQEPSIVGMWHIKFLIPAPGSPEPTVFDGGYSQWHSDGTEIHNSGSHPPDTGNFCLGVWEKVGEREYKLNHFTISWNDPAAKTPTGPGQIRETVTLSPDGKSFSGTFTIDQYDENLNLIAHVAGTVTATRIEVNTPPSNIF